MAGWIKLHRQITDSLVFKNEKCLKVWIWCLVKANHQENKTMIGRTKIVVEKGSFVMGSHTAKETLDMAISTIWYWLRFLEVEGMVEIKNTNKYSVVKLKKWSEYQEAESKSESNAQTDGKQMETNKKVKNEKNTERVFKNKRGEPITLVSGENYQADGFSPRDRLLMKRRLEKSLGLKKSSKWQTFIFGTARDFLTAFEKYQGYQYPDNVLLDEVAKTLAKWYELGETRETVREMLIAFFEGKKSEAVTVTPNSVFSSHTYNSWKQNKL